MGRVGVDGVGTGDGGKVQGCPKVLGEMEAEVLPMAGELVGHQGARFSCGHQVGRCWRANACTAWMLGNCPQCAQAP